MKTLTFRPSLSLLLAGLTLQALASSSSGAIVAYDGFVAGDSNAEGEYVPGADSRHLFTGQDPTLTGFTGAWTEANNARFELGTSPISSLAYSDGTNSLVTSGNAAFREFNNGVSSRALNVAGLNGDNTTTYFSFLLKLDDATALGRVEFSESASSFGTGIRIRTDGSNFIASAASSSTTLAATDTNTHLFVWKVDFGATTDAWSLWVDPTDLTTETTATLSGVSGTGTGNINLTHLVLMRETGGTAGNGFIVDEIRIGESWADVTPVPEPSTFALYAGMMALAGLMLRRRRLADRI